MYFKNCLFNSGSSSISHAPVSQTQPEVVNIQSSQRASQSDLLRTNKPKMSQTSKPIWFKRNQETVRYLYFVK